MPESFDLNSVASLGGLSSGVLTGAGGAAVGRQPSGCRDLRQTTIVQLLGAVSSASWVGQGAQGAVVKAQWRSGGCTVAVKWLVTDVGDMPAAYMEALVAKMLAHPFLVQTFDCAICQLDESANDQLAARGLLCGDPCMPTSHQRLHHMAAVVPTKGAASATTGRSEPVASLETTAQQLAAAAAAPAAAAVETEAFAMVTALDSFEGCPQAGVRPGGLAPVDCGAVLRQLGAGPGKYVVQIVSEWCDEGTLHAAIRRGVFRPQPPGPGTPGGAGRSRNWALRALLRTAREVAQGMCHLHSLHIIHGDLKPGNVLLKSSRIDSRGFVAKVADFGLSRLCSQRQEFVATADWGTVPYMAGEYLDNRLCKSSDVYSFGVLLWQMYTGKAPFAGHLEAQVAVGVMLGNLTLEWPPNMPPPLLRLGQACCRHEPDQRPPFKDVVVALSGIEAQVRSAALSLKTQRAAAASAMASAPQPLQRQHLQPHQHGYSHGGAGAFAAQQQAAPQPPQMQQYGLYDRGPQIFPLQSHVGPSAAAATTAAAAATAAASVAAGAGAGGAGVGDGDAAAAAAAPPPYSFVLRSASLDHTPPGDHPGRQYDVIRMPPPPHLLSGGCSLHSGGGAAATTAAAAGASGGGGDGGGSGGSQLYPAESLYSAQFSTSYSCRVAQEQQLLQQQREEEPPDPASQSCVPRPQSQPPQRPQPLQLPERRHCLSGSAARQAFQLAAMAPLPDGPVGAGLAAAVHAEAAGSGGPTDSAAAAPPPPSPAADTAVAVQPKPFDGLPPATDWSPLNMPLLYGGMSVGASAAATTQPQPQPQPVRLRSLHTMAATATVAELAAGAADGGDGGNGGGGRSGGGAGVATTPGTSSTSCSFAKSLSTICPSSSVWYCLAAPSSSSVLLMTARSASASTSASCLAAAAAAAAASPPQAHIDGDAAAAAAAAALAADADAAAAGAALGGGSYDSSFTGPSQQRLLSGLRGGGGVGNGMAVPSDPYRRRLYPYPMSTCQPSTPGPASCRGVGVNVTDGGVGVGVGGGGGAGGAMCRSGSAGGIGGADGGTGSGGGGGGGARSRSTGGAGSVGSGYIYGLPCGLMTVARVGRAGGEGAGPAVTPATAAAYASPVVQLAYGIGAGDVVGAGSRTAAGMAGGVSGFGGTWSHIRAPPTAAGSPVAAVAAAAAAAAATPLSLRAASGRRGSTGPALQHVPEDDGDDGEAAVAELAAAPGAFA